MAESNTLVGALRQTSREDWEVILRETVEGIVENADCPVSSYCDRRNGGFYLTCHEVFWSDSHTASSIVLDSADGEAVVAGAGITIAVNVIDTPLFGSAAAWSTPPRAGFTVMDVSPSLNVSVLVRLGSVLFTTTSTMKTPGRSGIGLMPFGA